MLALGAALVAPRASARERRRVLFVGNSYTYYNNMPRLAEAIGEALGQPFQTDMRATGGWSLADHLASGETLATIRTGGWTDIVFQEQSSFGDVYLVQGRFRIRPTTAWIENARGLVELARRAGARPWLLAHWSREDTPEDQALIDQACAQAARTTGAGLILTSAARRLYEDDRGRAALYAEDGSHPSPEASYLTAMTVVRALTGRTPHAPPGRIEGRFVAEDDGAVSDQEGVLAELPMTAVAAASSAVADAAGGAGRFRGVATAVEEPRMPTSERVLGPDDLAGLWAGPLRLYPRPVTLEVRFTHTGALMASVTLDFGQERRTVEGLSVTIRDQGRVVAFDYPEGPNGTTIRFEGVDTGGALEGVARFELETGGLRGVGDWRLDKRPG